MVLAIIAVFFTVVQSRIDFSRQRILSITGLNLITNVGPKVSTAPTESSGNSNSKKLMTVSRILTNGNFYNVFDLPFTPLFLAALFLIHPIIGAITSAVIIALLFISFLLTKLKPSGIFDQLTAKQAEFNQSNEASLSMGLNSGLISSYTAIAKRLATKEDKYLNTQASLVTTSKCVRMLLQIVIMGVAVLLAIQGSIDAGAVIASSILVSRALAPVEQSVSSWRNWRNGLQQCQELIKDGVLDKNSASKVSEDSGSPIMGKVKLEKVIVAYQRIENPTLRMLSYELSPGKSYVIAGPSGSGKTTLGKVLVGLIKPTSGSATWEGYNLDSLSPDLRIRNIGYLPQDVQVTPGTVLDNISRFSEHHERAIEMSKLIGLHEAIASLPEGYSTKLSSSTNLLSGGQKQLLGIARACFGFPNLIILDEPYSALDAKGEESLMRLIKMAKASGSIVVMISHKASLLNHFDNLIYLNKGLIESAGPVKKRNLAN